MTATKPDIFGKLEDLRPQITTTVVSDFQAEMWYRDEYVAELERKRFGSNSGEELTMRLLKRSSVDEMMQDWDKVARISYSLPSNDQSKFERAFFKLAVEVAHHNNWTCQELFDLLGDNKPWVIAKYL